MATGCTAGSFGRWSGTSTKTSPPGPTASTRSRPSAGTTAFSRSGRCSSTPKASIGTDERAVGAGVDSRLQLCCARRSGTRPPLFGRSSTTWMTGRRNTANGMRRGHSSCSRAAKAKPRRASGRFYSQAHNATLESDFYLWPIYKYNRVHSAPLDSQRTPHLLFPVFRLDGEEHRNGGGADAGRFLAVLHLPPRFQREQPAASPGPARDRSCPQARASSAITRRSGRSGVPSKNPQGGRQQPIAALEPLSARGYTRCQKVLAPVRSFPVSIQSRRQPYALVLYSLGPVESPGRRRREARAGKDEVAKVRRMDQRG